MPSNQGRAAMLNMYGEVVGEVLNAPDSGNSIKLAGGFTVDGTPVNCQKMKISRSKKNMLKAIYEPTVICVKDGIYRYL